MKIRQLSHVQIIALGFFLVIACGTALLMLLGQMGILLNISRSANVEKT